MAMKNIVAFDTLTELQNSADIRNGMIVITLGKQSIADGGAAIYRVIDSRCESSLLNNNMNKYSSNISPTIYFIKIDISSDLSQRYTDDKVSDVLQTTINLISTYSYHKQ